MSAVNRVGLVLSGVVCALGALPASAAIRIGVRVLDAAGKPVKDAVVFVHSPPKEKDEAPAQPAVMDQVNSEFMPHVLAVQAGSKVRFPNKDAIHHHLYSFSPAKPFDLPLYKGEPAEPITFDKPGVVRVGCNIHDWMNGIILVVPTRYFAVTDAAGKAALDLPAGVKSEVAVFHERLKGDVDATRKTVDPASGSASWSIALKEPRKKAKGKGDGY